MNLALDSNVFIYTLEDNPIFGQISASLLKSCLKGTTTVVLSEIILVEVLASSEMTNADVVKAQQWLEQLGFKYVPITKDILLLAAKLRRYHQLRTPDAIHLATATYKGATHFITNDQKLLHKKIKGIELVPLTGANILL